MKEQSDDQTFDRAQSNRSRTSNEDNSSQNSKPNRRNRSYSQQSQKSNHKKRQDELEEPLMKKQKQSNSLRSGKQQSQDEFLNEVSFKQKINEYFFKRIQNHPRKINLLQGCSPKNYQNNIVKNTKYNIITFIPKVLYNQFKFFFNMFFLITALSQLIEQLKVGLFVTFIGPLAMVLTLTMAKQAYDDYRTYLRDIQQNSKKYEVIRKKTSHQRNNKIKQDSNISDGNERDYKKIKLKSKDLKVGDIVIINSGDRIPADMLTLYSDNDQGTLFLKTDQLDGETDWKLRKSVKITQNLLADSQNYGKLLDSRYQCIIKQPIGQIYQFEGIFIRKKENQYEPVSLQKQQHLQQISQNSKTNSKQKLTLQNTLWASTVLTNGKIIGLVIYTGNQTRMAMGANQPRTKFGILDMQINFLSKILFAIMVGLTAMLLLLQKTSIQYIPIQFTRILILLSSIIPISMRVNLDFAKLFYAYQINNDKFIQDTITRNSNCPEQLGRVKYILSDKTGTLTQNQMLFKCISIQDTLRFKEEAISEMKEIIKSYQNNDQKQPETKQKMLNDIIAALAICHNVTPVYNTQSEQLDENGQASQKLKKSSPPNQEDQSSIKKDFQASSPDQIAFVKLVQVLGVSLHDRSQTTLVLKLPDKKKVEFEILRSFPFSSETKRMGIIVKNLKNDQITFYLKGADAVMAQLVNNKLKRGFIQEQCRDLSRTGLRTLVITKKQISEQEYKSWNQRYLQAQQKLEADQKELSKLRSELQKGVQFLGITGIEDKLQNRLKPTIESLKSAGIKMWMITGDKIQTAQCIGRSCGLQKLSQENIKFQGVSGSDWTSKWQKAKQDLNKVLIIDGKTLSYVIQKASKQIQKDFYKTAMLFPAVICCRCSPQQKKILTEGVKQNKNQKQAVLGIGDGGNDVGMIQAADVGIGIVGKEGKQAALAADFSIMQFKNLKCLLLWHGRLSYKRSALLASFIIHRGFIISAIQIIFSCIFFYVSIPVFNSYLQLGYATFFTFWPVFSMILDTDIDIRSALKYPALYSSLQKTNQLSAYHFLSWLYKASFQGFLIIILSIVLFEDQTYRELQTICFTVLIITQYCMTMSQIHRIHILTILLTLGSLICYGCCLLFLRQFLMLADLSFSSILMIFLVVAISWGPLLVLKLAKKHFFPSDYQKVMKNVKRSVIDRKLIQGQIQKDEESSLQ